MFKEVGRVKMPRSHVVLCVVFLIFSLAACTGNNNQTTDRDGEALRDAGVHDPDASDFRYQWNDGDHNFSRQNPNIRVGNPTPRTLDAEARRMEQAAERVDGVHNATVVIRGGTATVGLEVNDALDQTQVNAVAAEVERRLSSLVPRYRVHVAADEEAYHELRDLSDRIQRGDGNWRTLQQRMADMRDEWNNR